MLLRHRPRHGDRGGGPRPSRLRLRPQPQRPRRARARAGPSSPAARRDGRRLRSGRPSRPVRARAGRLDALVNNAGYAPVRRGRGGHGRASGGRSSTSTSSGRSRSRAPRCRAMRAAGGRHDRDGLFRRRDASSSRSPRPTAPASTPWRPSPTRCAWSRAPSESASCSSSRDRSRLASTSAPARCVAPLLSRPGPTGTSTPGPSAPWTAIFRWASGPPRSSPASSSTRSKADRPRPRYPVGLMARVLIPVRRLLPDRWIDFLMRKSLKMPRGS